MEDINHSRDVEFRKVIGAPSTTKFQKKTVPLERIAESDRRAIERGMGAIEDLQARAKRARRKVKIIGRKGPIFIDICSVYVKIQGGVKSAVVL